MPEASPTLLDLRGLPPPQPLERILAALEQRPGTTLRCLLSREPVLIYALLRGEGCRYRASHGDDGWELVIEPAVRAAP